MRADRWERQAERVNARNAAEAPLFVHAGLIEQVTAAQRRTQMRRSWAAQDAKMQATLAQFCRDIAHRISLLSAFLDPESLEALDEYRWRTYPPTAEYGAGFWRDVVARLMAGEPAMPACRVIRASEVID
jgi:hypothetical protein